LIFPWLTDEDALTAYRADPFNPHAIARTRLSAYQKSIVMKYIDNLLDWGDSLFNQFTMESVNETTMLYVIAQDILGPRPARLGSCGEGTGFSEKNKKTNMPSVRMAKRWPAGLLTALSRCGRFRVAKELRTLQVPHLTDYLYSLSVAFSPDGQPLASGTDFVCNTCEGNTRTLVLKWPRTLVRHYRSSDVDRQIGEVNVTPFQSEQLAPTQSRRRVQRGH
jgi:hypothetical protein